MTTSANNHDAAREGGIPIDPVDEDDRSWWAMQTGWTDENLPDNFPFPMNDGEKAEQQARIQADIRRLSDCWSPPRNRGDEQ